MGRRLQTLLSPVAAAALAVASGCSVDFYARGLVTHRNLNGKIKLWFLGGVEHLIAKGTISARYRVAAPDGVELDVWMMDRQPGTPARGTIVAVHGILDSKARMMTMSRRLTELGYDVVLPDLRAHGHSGGHYVTFGAKESLDIKAVVDALLSDGIIHGPIYVFGQSMGGTIAILYAAADPRCKVVVAAAPYKDLHSIARRFVPVMRGEKYDRVVARAGEIADFDPGDTSALAGAEKLAAPLLVIHGRLDCTVPISHGRAIYEAARGPKKFIPVPLHGHTTLLLLKKKWFAEQTHAWIREACEAARSK